MSSPISGADDFDQLYQGRYLDIVATVHALVGDLGEAQDLTQEAFCRAWQRWSRLAGYDDPAAWVRRVAVNLAMSRWRRLAVARRHALRQERPATVPPLEPDHVVLVAALRTLPVNQRCAVVLHHLVDLPVEQIADELGVAVGTVKSWLRRGRIALAGRLGSDDTKEASRHD
jgi:RNA polymerase sigma-70 factor (ECF subfamily)